MENMQVWSFPLALPPTSTITVLGMLLCTPMHVLSSIPIHLLSVNLPNPFLILLIHLPPQAAVAASSVLSVLKQSPTSLIKCP